MKQLLFLWAAYKAVCGWLRYYGILDAQQESYYDEETHEVTVVGVRPVQPWLATLGAFLAWKY